MKTLVLALCLMLIGLAYAKDGYLVIQKTGCKMACTPVSGNSYCNNECTSPNYGGKSGSCYLSACYCEGLPPDTKVYPLPNKPCGK
uniref:NaTx n=1 Tax=Centruroides hentzi TaxID=88313 RepID=A0A2I9LPA8_9SCOR